MKKSILIVDDDKSLLIALRAYLEGKGYSVTTASDSWHGLEMAMKTPPDLLLLDINMPGLDGFNALSTLRRIEGGTEDRKGLPVIIISAMGEKQNVLRASGLEAVDFLVKPFDIDDLGHRVRIQLFTLEFPDLRQVLSTLQQPGEKFTGKLGALVAQGWRPHFSLFNGLRLCVLFSSTIRVKHPMQLTYEECLSGLLVYAECSKRWRQVWPIVESLPATHSTPPKAAAG